MDWGSLADWVGAAGGLLAVIAAFTAWKTSRRMLNVEHQRDSERHKEQEAVRVAKERSQAELFCVLGAVLTERDSPEKWSIYLYNGSSKPIYGIEIHSQKADGSSTNRPLRLGALPPGRFVVPSASVQQNKNKSGWGSLIDLSLAPEPVDLLVRGKANDMITSVSFQDSERRQWSLEHGTELSSN